MMHGPCTTPRICMYPVCESNQRPRRLARRSFWQSGGFMNVGR